MALIPGIYLRRNDLFQVVGKGTASFGKRHNKTHITCRRCGKRSLHLQKGTCSACGYPSARLRKCTCYDSCWFFQNIVLTVISTDNWATKAQRRRTTGTGRCRYLKTLPRKFKVNFIIMRIISSACDLFLLLRRTDSARALLPRARRSAPPRCSSHDR